MPCTCPVLGTATPEFAGLLNASPTSERTLLCQTPPLPDQKLRLDINMFPFVPLGGRPLVFFRRNVGSPAFGPRGLPEFGDGES